MKHKANPFSHNGRELTVTAIHINHDKGWSVRVYEDEKPVTYVEYTVSFEAQVDASMQYQGLDLVEDLMLLAQQEVEQNRVILKK